MEVSFVQCSAGTSQCANTIDGAAVLDDFCSSWFSAAAAQPRGVFITEDGDILVVDRVDGRVLLLHDDDLDGVSEAFTVVAQQSGLNHGIVVRDGKLYASSATTVYRWSFATGQRTTSTDPEVVVSNIESGGHTTRTLDFDADGNLYISVGSRSNWDADSSRSRIRRFPVLDSVPSGGFVFQNGEVFADGLRNEVGLAFDKFGVLWGVENSADNLNRGDLGGDIHKDNPAEELNRFATAGQNFGYPYCWTEFSLAGGEGRGTVWASPQSMNDGVHTDAWCRANTVAPALSMQAHSAPLGITFFDASKTLAAGCPAGESFPAWMDGDAFVGYHGSWNRSPATGYKVVRIPMDDQGMPAVEQPLDFFCHGNSGAAWSSGLRPVDLKFDQCNRLVVTSDGSGGRGAGVLVIRYNGGEDQTGSGGAAGDGAAGSTPAPTQPETTPIVSGDDTSFAGAGRNLRLGFLLLVAALLVIGVEFRGGGRGGGRNWLVLLAAVLLSLGPYVGASV